MKDKLFFFIFGILNLFCSVLLYAQKNNSVTKWVTASPNGFNKITVLNNSGKLFYFVTQQNDTVIKSSMLGIEGTNSKFTNNIVYEKSEERRIDETYSMLIGKRNVNRNLANETLLGFKNNSNQTFRLIVRAYNDGVAFRYSFPEIKESTVITNETTSFKLALKGKAWLTEYGLPTDYAPAYENNFTNGSNINQNAPDSSGWAFPALFRSNKRYILFTEAGLDENFYASHLQQDCSDSEYKITHPMSGEALGKYNVTATADKPFATPWRVVIFGKSLGPVIESNLVYHLSEKNKLGDVSWVKPGRSSWSWWGDHQSSENFSILKHYIDLSKIMGWEYSLVDANWDVMKGGGNIQDLIKYAKKQGVLLTLWYNSGGEHNNVSDGPRNIMSNPAKRREEFKKLNSWGIKAVKVDFFNSDKQQLIKLYLDILKDAASERIMVIFHGCTLPRGWSRTYPNLISMEAIKGAEQYAYDKTFAKNAPVQNITATCTRNVVGPMDYTPVIFSDYDSLNHHVTTNAYELATSVLFESGMLHFGDRVTAYNSLHESVKQFLKIVPVAWDDTKYIKGYPGKLMVLARKRGNDWFMAGANGETVAKNISLNFSFLPRGRYKLLLMKDCDSASEIKTEKIEYTRGKSITVKMLGNGGFTVWIKKYK